MPMINDGQKLLLIPTLQFVAEDEYPPNQIAYGSWKIATPVWDMRNKRGPESEEWANKQGTI